MRVRVTLLRLSAAAALVAGGAVDVAAQISTIFLEDWDLSVRSSRNSARLEAMAGAWVGVEDESNEINMWDYGANVAGFLDDRDAWTGDFWAAVTSRDRRVGNTVSSGGLVESGVQLSFRRYDRALGLEGGLIQSDNEEGLLGGDEDVGDKRKFSGPAVNIVANQAVGESFLLGLGLGFVSEEEKLTSTNSLGIEHATSRTDLSLGALYFPTDKLDLGASLTLVRNRIDGKSEDGLHRDEYDWDRPITVIGAQAIYGAETDLQGGAFISHRKLDGGEVLSISWSREFFLNPSGVDLSLDVAVLNEERTETIYGSRWFYRAADWLGLGVDARILSGDYVARVNPTFPAFLDPADEEFDETALAAGFTLSPVPRLRLVGQVEWGERELVAAVREDTQTETTTVTGFRGGAEFFWRRNVAVRGGVHLLNDETELVAPLATTKNEFERLRWTAGAGWAPSGGVFSMDIAFGFDDFSATKPDGLDDQTDGFSVMLTGRTLFR